MADGGSNWYIKQEIEVYDEEFEAAGTDVDEQPPQVAAALGTEVETNAPIKQERAADGAANEPRKKYQHTKQHGLSDYNKKHIFKKWQASNFSKEGFEKAVKTMKVDLDEAKAYFQKQIDEAQAHVHEEVDTKAFRNANQWLKRLEELGLDKDGNNESALIFSAMAQTQDLPKPEELDGLCLKTCYQYIANAALGKPPPEMNATTTAFLVDHYKDEDVGCKRKRPDDPTEEFLATKEMEKETDDCDRLGELWASKLRKLSGKQQLLAEKFIHEIFYEGQQNRLWKQTLHPQRDASRVTIVRPMCTGASTSHRMTSTPSSRS